MFFLKNLIKTSFILIILQFFLSCSGPKNTEINILYLYDISGSYHQKSLKESVRISENIFNSVVSTDGIPYSCLLYTSPSPRDGLLSRMPSSA